MGVKIHYNSDDFQKHKWYPMPIHGEDFKIGRKSVDIPTEWSIQRLEAGEEAGGDIEVVESGFTYFDAKAICDAHNTTIASLNIDHRKELEALK